jgi:hypothetical protein
MLFSFKHYQYYEPLLAVVMPPGTPFLADGPTAGSSKFLPD